MYTPHYLSVPLGGEQQEEPLGSFLFCMSIHPFCVEYLHDIMLGGSRDEIFHDLEVIKTSSDLA